VIVIAPSQTLQTVFLSACRNRDPSRVLEVIVCQTGPQSEGIEMSKFFLREIRDGSILVRLIPDCQMAVWIQKADCCVVGADCVFEHGSFVNTCGTYLLALSAFNNSPRIPFYVCCQSSRFLSNAHLREIQRQTCLYLNSTNTSSTVERVEASSMGRSISSALHRVINRQGSVNVFAASDLPVNEVDNKAPIGFPIERESGEVIMSRSDQLAMNLDSDYFLPSSIPVECTPAHYVSAYVTEFGMLTPSEIGQFTNRAKRPVRFSMSRSF